MGRGVRGRWGWGGEDIPFREPLGVEAAVELLVGALPPGAVVLEVGSKQGTGLPALRGAMGGQPVLGSR